MDSKITSKKVPEHIERKRLPLLTKAFENNGYSVTYNNPTLTAKKDDNTYTLNLGDYPFSVYIKLNNGDQKNWFNMISNDNDFVNKIYENYNEAAIMEKECPVCLLNIPGTILSCRRHTICLECYTELHKRSENVACPICRSVGAVCDGGQIKQMNRSTRKRTTRKRTTRKRSTRKRSTRKRSGQGTMKRKNVKSARILTAK
jgi:hypothetical protein